MQPKEDAMTAMALTMLGVLAAGQTPMEPARDLFLHTVRAPGVEIRFVDYHWQPALFAAMEKGTREIPEATRNWVIARVVLNAHPLTLEGARLGVGNYGLVLWPNLDGKGMGIEVREIDMREVYPKLNVIAPAPRGETIYRGPARFEVVDPPVPRMDMTLGEEGGSVTLTLNYGDRRLVLSFTP
jgi:hypothetical protein